MDVQDERFRDVGRCEQLEALWCMYCRDTTDTATEHIADAGLAFLARLPRLREVSLDGLPHVTREGAAVFPARVRVEYSA